MRHELRRKAFPARAKRLHRAIVAITLVLLFGLTALVPAPIAIALMPSYELTYAPGASGVTNMPNPLTKAGEYGEIVTAEAAPARAGYTFAGWKAETESVTFTMRVGPWIDVAPQSVKDIGDPAAEAAWLSLINNYTAYLWRIDTPTSPTYTSVGVVAVKAVPSGKNDGTGIFTFKNIPTGTYLIQVLNINKYVDYFKVETITAKTEEIKSTGILWSNVLGEGKSPMPTGYYDVSDEDNDGVVWMVPGDLTHNYLIDANDVGNLNNAIVGGWTFADLWKGVNPNYDVRYDLNNDGLISMADYDDVIKPIKGSNETLGFGYFDYADTWEWTTVLHNPPESNALLSLTMKLPVPGPIADLKIDDFYQPAETFALPGNTTLTAQWVQNKYSVTYNAGAGTGAPTDGDDYLYGDTATVKDGTPVRTGFTFLGWQYGGNVYKAGDTITVNENVEFVAQWRDDSPNPTTYTVTVTGSYAGSETNGSGPYIEGATVEIKAGTRSGYTFIGWRVVSGGVTLANQNNATTTFVMPANDVTVEARWDFDEPPTTESPSTESPPPVEPPPTEEPSPETPPPVEPPPVEPPPVEPPPYVPGGNDFQTPPLPMAPSSELVMDGDGWLELDETGTPLGKWEWDGTEWVFDEYEPPLSALPPTGIQSYAVFYLLALGMLLGCTKRISLRIKKTQKTR